MPEPSENRPAFAAALDQFGGRVALVTDSGDSLSYRDLTLAGDRWARQVQPRSLTFLLCDGRSEAVVAYVGLLRAGAAIALLPAALGQAKLAALRSLYRPAFACVPASESAMWETADVVAPYGSYVLLGLENAGQNPIHPDLALLLTTSGSTGSPKFVRLSHANLQSNAVAIRSYLGITGDERAITTLPLQYSYGLSIVNSHLAAGASLAVTDKTLVDRGFWDFLNASRATSFGGVPQTYRMLQRLRFSERSFPNLRYLTQAGGRLEPELTTEFVRSCGRRGMRFYTMYGQTEATARMAYVPWDRALEKAGSIGVPIPGGRLWLEDESGRPVGAPGVQGELVYQGPNVSLGYAESARDLERGDDNRGVLRTGDIAVCDQEGFYTVVGRQKRFIKMFGVRVSLDDVEVLVRGAGFECACTGVDDHLVVHVVGRGQAGAVLQYLVSTAGFKKAAIVVRERDDLPMNDAGKVQYASLSGH